MVILCASISIGRLEVISRIVFQDRKITHTLNLRNAPVIPASELVHEQVTRDLLLRQG